MQISIDQSGHKFNEKIDNMSAVQVSKSSKTSPGPFFVKFTFSKFCDEVLLPAQFWISVIVY